MLTISKKKDKKSEARRKEPSTGRYRILRGPMAVEGSLVGKALDADYNDDGVHNMALV
jgi:hypothetical protein